MVRLCSLDAPYTFTPLRGFFSENFSFLLDAAFPARLIWGTLIRVMCEQPSHAEKAMHCNLRQFVPAIACGLLLLGTASTADAGFISTAQLTSGEVSLGLDLSSRSVGGMATQPVAQEDDLPVPEREGVKQPGLLSTMNASGSMSSQTSIGSGGSGGFSAIALTPTTPSSGRLEIRLARRRDRYHPRFIKSRLFRPPRS